jgi:hypothetical protein
MILCRQKRRGRTMHVELIVNKRRGRTMHVELIVNKRRGRTMHVELIVNKGCRAKKQREFKFNKIMTKEVKA